MGNRNNTPIEEFFIQFGISIIVILVAVVVAYVITVLILSPSSKKTEYKRNEIKYVNDGDKVEFITKNKKLYPSLSKLSNDLDEKAASFVKLRINDIRILRVLTHEGGCDQKTCNYVAQALYNACEKYNWQYSPLEMIFKYQYAEPLSWWSKEAERAYTDVFKYGIRFPEIGNATIFYAPGFCTSSYHESQIFIHEWNGVRYFEERN